MKAYRLTKAAEVHLDRVIKDFGTEAYGGDTISDADSLLFDIQQKGGKATTTWLVNNGLYKQSLIVELERQGMLERPTKSKSRRK